MNLQLQDLAQFLLLLGVGLLIYLVRGIPIYIKQKAENLAQKEDLEVLTDIVQRVRAQFDKANLVHNSKPSSEVIKTSGGRQTRSIRVL